MVDGDDTGLQLRHGGGVVLCYGVHTALTGKSDHLNGLLAHDGSVGGGEIHHELARGSSLGAEHASRRSVRSSSCQSKHFIYRVSAK
jgi:hypothetical protein